MQRHSRASWISALLVILFGCDPIVPFVGRRVKLYSKRTFPFGTKLQEAVALILQRLHIVYVQTAERAKP